MIAAAGHITTISSTDQGLAVAILLLVALAFGALVCLHVIDRGVDPVSMAVSDYGAREHAWFYRVAAIWLGLAGLLAAVLLADAVFPKPSLVIFCLLIFAATRWAITIFPTDIEGEQPTPVGRAHLVLAIAAFATIAVAAGQFAVVARDDPFWSPHSGLLGLLGWALPVVAVLMGLSRRFFAQAFGAIERAYYLLIFGWLAAIALIVL